VSTDVVVVGAGPAGLALAGQASARGLAVTVVDPAPRRRWGRTFGLWDDELDDPGLRSTIAAVHHRVSVVGSRRVDVARSYAVFDTDRLQQALWDRCTGVEVRTARVTGAGRTGLGWSVEVADGEPARAAVVVDCSGARRAVLGRVPGVRAEQVAFGLEVDRAALGLAPGEAVFMDWRDDHGEGGEATFLYALDRGEGRALAEETSLARRPGADPGLLERRLRARLAARGVPVEAGAPVERVRFPLDVPVPDRSGPVGFGAAGGMVHPASGYSVAASLALAGPLAAALADGLAAGGPAEAMSRGHDALWPRRARLARSLHERGLWVLLGLQPGLIPSFFETFLALRPATWAGYLAAPADLRATLGAMSALWLSAPPRLKAALAVGTVRGQSAQTGSPGSRRSSPIDRPGH
jgi:lycopene beta-cyclase